MINLTRPPETTLRRWPDPLAGTAFVTEWALEQTAGTAGRSPDAPVVLVVGFDGSEPARRALDAAAGLLRDREGMLEVVYVAPSSPTPADNLESRLAHEVRARLDTTDPSWHFQRRDGAVAHELLDVADELRRQRGPDATVVLVVGGSSNQHPHVAGSVSSNLAEVDRFPSWSCRSACRSFVHREKWRAEMPQILYTAEALVTGGRASGHGRTSDGALDVQLRSPKEMGGVGGGTNPEQLFAVGYAACFESALGVVGRRERVEVGDVSIDSRVSLLPNGERGFMLAVALDVTLPQVQDPEQAARIVAAAHKVCPYSNATRGNIDVTLTANGQTIAEPVGSRSGIS